MDAVHNLSDQLALTCLWLAYVLAISISRGLQRSANVLNSAGLLLVSAVVVWQAVDRVIHPQAVIGWLPIVVGLAAAAGNWSVARILGPWRRTNPANGLAYLHNLGDAYVSLAPVAAGVLVSVFDVAIFDPLAALAVGLWLLATTVRELRRSTADLLWPEEVTCPHDAHAAG